MLFITTLFICSFCFVVYLIWSQFLKKDTSLHVGLKVLHKKMSLLEDFSHKTDQQLRAGIELLDQKNKDLEKIVKEARFCIFKMEKLIHNFDSIKKEDSPDEEKKKIALVQNKTDAPIKKSNLSLIEKENESSQSQKKISKFQFGESPFANLNFVEKSTSRKKDSDSSDEEPPSPQI